MKGHGVQGVFLREVRRALNHLYDPVELARSPLAALFGVAEQEDVASALQRILLDAIAALKPARGVPMQSGAWRVYQTLLHRYVEHFTQREVARTLALSIRHLRRQERQALSVLAESLWNRYGLAEKSRSSLTSSAGDALTPSRAQELDWSQQTFTSEPVDIADLLETVRRTATPLLHAMQVRLEQSIADHLPRMDTQLPTVREALLSLLTMAIRRSAAETVTLSAETDSLGIRVTIVSGLGKPADDEEGVAIARELVEAAGGALDIEADGRFVATVRLPSAERIVVLAIDDNPDTLRLLRRYVSGTRYALMEAKDPTQAEALAQEVQPQAIVLDVMLPGIDGWELLGRLREHPATAHIPIIVCTILVQEELALALGAAAYLRKPVSRNDFLATLDRCVNRFLSGS